MKINKGKIKNINKKVLAGLLTFSLVPMIFSGCEERDQFTYSINEQGEYVVEGNIEFDLLKNYYFIEIDNVQFQTKEFYIAERRKIAGRYGVVLGYYYIDIFTQNEVFRKTSNGDNFDSESSRVFINELELEDYLYGLNNVKGSYTKEDVETILNSIKEMNIKPNDKQLIKGNN